MRMYRSTLLSFGGLALCASMLTIGSVSLVPTAALACPEEAQAGEKACSCGKDQAACDAAKAAGACEGGCGEKAKDAKACACAPGEDGKCACGADCPSEHGGNCTKEGAAAPAEEKPGGCMGEKGEGASAAPSGGAGLQAVIDPATGEFVAPAPAQAAALAADQPEAAGGTQGIREIAVAGAGTMAEFPESRVSRAVATVDANGKTQVGCERGAE